MKDTTFIRLQHYAPHHLLSRFAGWVAFRRLPWLKNAIIAAFIRRYHVDMSEAATADITEFEHFNDFFTRRLKPGVRPLSGGTQTIISPADGVISQTGLVTDGRVLQAKGHEYTVKALLANAEWAELFQGGSFATIYLSPKDYHRIHMPMDGTLRQMTYVPGKLFSVNQCTAMHIPNLFVKNERLVCLFDTAVGPMAVVLVGAMIVGSMATAWAGTIKPHQPKISTWTYANSAEKHIHLKKGEELGLFHLGSTVVVLFPHQALAWNALVQPNSPIRMGNALGVII